MIVVAVAIISLSAAFGLAMDTAGFGRPSVFWLIGTIGGQLAMAIALLGRQL